MQITEPTLTATTEIGHRYDECRPFRGVSFDCTRTATSSVQFDNACDPVATHPSDVELVTFHTQN
jgi:hypothetical protein